MLPSFLKNGTVSWHGSCCIRIRGARPRSVSGLGSRIYGAMKHKNSHLLVGYWSRLRAGRDVPDQTDIDPRAIKRLLSYAFILDCENPARPAYRLAGTALCERFGYELKGTGFLGHWEAHSSLSLAALLRQSLKLRQPICLSSIATTADNGLVELETILTPMTFNGGEPTRIFGMVQMFFFFFLFLGRV